jgi:hypothetical protein
MKNKKKTLVKIYVTFTLVLIKFYSIHNQLSKILWNNLEVLIGSSFFMVSFPMLLAPQTTQQTVWWLMNGKDLEQSSGDLTGTILASIWRNWVTPWKLQSEEPEIWTGHLLNTNKSRALLLYQSVLTVIWYTANKWAFSLQNKTQCFILFCQKSAVCTQINHKINSFLHLP